MRIPLPAAHPINLRQFLLRCGYSSHCNPLANRLSFARRLGADRFPRFHIYVGKHLSGQTYFQLHLDQKQPSYPGVHAHSAEHDSPLVAAEAQRLARLLQVAVLPEVAPEVPRFRWWPWRPRGES